MTTVEADFVWTHENAGQVKWHQSDDGWASAWLSAELEVSVGPNISDRWSWWIVLYTGHYPFVHDQELGGDTGFFCEEDAKFAAIRWACRWLSLQEAEDGLMELVYAEQERAQALHDEHLESLSDDEHEFDALEYAGRDEPHADLQRWC